MNIEWESNHTKQQMTWVEAMRYAHQHMTMSEDWRLPTRAELVEAFDNGMDGFEQKSYWSSTSHAKDTDYAWDVHFLTGYVNSSPKTNTACVRLVKNI